MKKLVLFLLCSCFVKLAVADNDKPIAFSELPQPAQMFVKKYFGAQKVAMTKVDKDFLDASYDVVFTNGQKVEFDKKGNWKEVQCRNQAVPSAIIPPQILKYVESTYPQVNVVRIEKDRYEYEVYLSNRWELKFDMQFNLIDMDQDD